MRILILLILVLFTLYLFLKKRKFVLPFFFMVTLVYPSGLGIEFSGVVLTYTRIMTIILILLIPITKSIQRYQNNFPLLTVLFTIIISLELLSSLNSEYRLQSYLFYIFDDALHLIGILFLASELFRIDKFDIQVQKFYKYFIPTTLLIYVAGLIEYFVQRSFYDIIGIYSILNESYIGPAVRESIYRISGTFNESLFFAYYIGFSLTLAILGLRLKIFSSKQTIFIKIIAVLSVVMSFLTNSRTGLVLIIIPIIYVFLIENVLKRLNIKLIRISGIIFLITFIIITLNFESIFNFINVILGTGKDYLSDESLRERSLQVFYFISIFDEFFLLGNGRINTYELIRETNILRSLDSIWIKYFLESGFISVIIFLIVLIYPLKNLWRKFKFTKFSYYKDIYGILLVYHLQLILMYTFSSNQELRILIFIGYYFMLYYSTKEKIEKNENITNQQLPFSTRWS